VDADGGRGGLVALVTGSTRGIGAEVARQLAAGGYRVVVTRRSAEHRLDVSDPSSIEALARYVEREIGRLDVLVNNAAILLDEGESIVDVDPHKFEETWRVNTFGAFLMTQRFAPLLRRSGHGRVVNVSSGAGQLSSMSSYAPSYSTSKAALNAITILFANALRRDGVLVNCADPGWVCAPTWAAARRRAASPKAPTRSSGWRRCRTMGRPAGSFTTGGRSTGELALFRQHIDVDKILRPRHRALVAD
jgi:NAD(P)-dependent dehydrogenase (short-subunit alcohol dehydrogenase family)